MRFDQIFREYGVLWLRATTVYDGDGYFFRG